MDNQIAFFKKDGSIEVIDHPGPETTNITAFNNDFADKLADSFWLIVNLKTIVYPYNVVDGKVRL